ncbi:hypothetical protein P171DRAFT_522459 [Karstenula rhodostoma CBS 690.94]|uniref:Uncharacterized protein n=1 Tax=Karstenula rhodostoma CBS 690.94 TaxID=1392251 RepID=A0A9P4UAX8_9PLEO|nr:hypothetical protein P171DRAFT_522459 [Karstenula rhodostoma CBS 690.94]
MPPKKKQKTGVEPAHEEEHEFLETRSKTPSGASGEGEEEGDDVAGGRKIADIPPYEYVCVYRPRFDCRLAVNNEEKGEENEDEDEEQTAFKVYRKTNDVLTNEKLFAPASDIPEWKWVMMMEGWKTYCEWRRRSNYCQPDYLQMYISNDFYGYGIQELLENLLIKFDAAIKEKTEEGRMAMWAVLSTTALWLTAGQGNDYMMTDDGARTAEVSALTGAALLTGLASIEESGELKADSKFLDLGIVITSFLLWAKDHEDYGIEDEAVAWREHAVAYFDRSGLAFDKGISGTEDLLKKFRGQSSSKPIEIIDLWGWTLKFVKYGILYATNGKIGGTNYDITKMTRKERASYAFDKTDPLKNFSAKDIQEGYLEIK